MIRVLMQTVSIVLLGATVSTAQVAGPPEQGGAARSPEALQIPEGPRWLGSMRIPVDVRTEDGVLPAGTYRVRMTGETWKDAPPGASEALLPWIEFVQDGEVKGRTIGSIVPAADVAQVVEGSTPEAGRLRVDRLRGDGDDFIRGWYSFGGDQLLLHLAAAGVADGQG